MFLSIFNKMVMDNFKKEMQDLGLTKFNLLGRLVRFGGPLISAYIVEFIGVFFLVMSVGFNQGNPLAPLAIGSTLMVMIFMGGHISGAHFNPAVTLGVRLTGRDHITNIPAVIYISVQLIAGLAASLIVWGCAGYTFAPTPGFKPNGDRVNLGVAFILEFFWTFALVSVMLNCATTKSQTSNSFFGLAIGFTVVSGAWSVGHISGGAFNPAVATGPLILHSIVTKFNHFQYIWIYWLGDFLGSIVAAIIFRVTNSPEYRMQAVISPASPRYQFGNYTAEGSDEV